MTTASTPLRFDPNLKWLFTELPFEQRFDAAAKAGFRAVEYADPYPYSPDQLKKWLANADLEQILINSPAGAADGPGRNGWACVPDRVKEFRDGFSSALEYAVALDCDGDALVVKVDQVGAACHTGDRTCFDADVLEAVTGEAAPVAP